MNGYVFVGLPAAILLTWLAYEYWHRSPAALYDKRFRELREDMKRRGLTDEQKDDEFAFRRAMARLRRRASAAAKRNPATARETIKKLVNEEADLMTSRRSVRRRFAEVASEGPISDVLYPDAMKAVDRHDRRHASPSPVSEDDIAWVTTR